MAPSPVWLEPLRSVCAALAALLQPHAEVVVHDIASDRILAIWNPFSGRREGDPSLLDELPEADGEWTVFGPYAKVLPDGRELSAVSAVVCDDGGRPAGLVCVNLDRSPLLDAAKLLQALAAPVADRPPELFARDWREQIALVIDEQCRALGASRARLSRDERLQVVRALDERGLFATRHAAHHAASALGVSRALVYSLLKEARR